MFKVSVFIQSVARVVFLLHELDNIATYLHTRKGGADVSLVRFSEIEARPCLETGQNQGHEQHLLVAAKPLLVNSSLCADSNFE